MDTQSLRSSLQHVVYSEPELRKVIHYEYNITSVFKVTLHHCGLEESARTGDGTGCEFGFWQCRIYIISHVHRGYDYLGLFGVLRVHMAWCEICVIKVKHKIESASCCSHIHEESYKCACMCVTLIFKVMQWSVTLIFKVMQWSVTVIFKACNEVWPWFSKSRNEVWPWFARSCNEVWPWFSRSYNEDIQFN